MGSITKNIDIFLKRALKIFREQNKDSYNTIPDW